MLGLVESHLDRCGLHLAEALSAARLERLKCQSLELIQTTERIQALAHLLADIPLAADTDLQLAKARVAHRHILAQVALSAAEGTVGVAEASARCSRRIHPRGTGCDLFQRLVYPAFRHGLLPSSVSKWLHNISSCACCASQPA